MPGTRVWSQFVLLLALPVAACQSPTTATSTFSVDDIVESTVSPPHAVAAQSTDGKTYRVVRGNNQPDDVLLFDWVTSFEITLTVNSNATDEDVDLDLPDQADVSHREGAAGDRRDCHTANRRRRRALRFGVDSVHRQPDKRRGRNRDPRFSGLVRSAESAEGSADHRVHRSAGCGWTGVHEDRQRRRRPVEAFLKAATQIAHRSGTDSPTIWLGSRDRGLGTRARHMSQPPHTAVWRTRPTLLGAAGAAAGVLLFAYAVRTAGLDDIVASVRKVGVRLPARAGVLGRQAGGPDGRLDPVRGRSGAAAGCGTRSRASSRATPSAISRRSDRWPAKAPRPSSCGRTCRR